MRKPTSRLEFSQPAIKKLPAPKSGRVHHYDTREEGLGIRVEPTAKMFFWFRKVRGNPTFKSIGSFPSVSVEEARDQAKEWNGKLARYKRNNYEGQNPFESARRDLTLGGLLDRYIEKHVRQKASHPERAEQDTRWMAEKYFASWHGRKLGEIRREDVRDLHEKLTTAHGKITADRSVQLIRRLYYWAASEKVELWKGENPATRISLHGDTKRDRFLQPDELVRLHHALKTETHSDLKDFVELALATGARRGNVLGMQWSEVNDQNWIWSIPRTSTKNNKPHVVVLMPAAIAVLKRRQGIATSSPFVFPSHSKSGHLVELKKPWTALLARAGISDFVIHDLRRTCASYQAIAGQPLLSIAASLGHRSTSSTEIYARLNTDAARASLLAGASAMKEAMQGARRKQKVLAGGARG